MIRGLPWVAAAVVGVTAVLVWDAVGAEPRWLQFPPRLDASTDSLVLEADPDVRLYNRTRILFSDDEFVLVGVVREDVFTEEGVEAIGALHRRLAEVEGVDGGSVRSIAYVPLLRSHAKRTAPVRALADGLTLVDAEGSYDPRADLEKAQEELTHHALFRGNLISEDGGAAGILVPLAMQSEWIESTSAWLAAQDDAIVARRAAEEAPGDAEVGAALAEAEAALAEARARYDGTERERKDARIATVKRVEAVVAAEREAGVDARASGVPALVVQMVGAIERDLSWFLYLSAGFVVVFLAAVFRSVRWVVLPLLVSGSTVVWTLAGMQALGKPVTVITANIPALLLVIGLAHSIHMAVRYRELLVRFPEDDRVARAGRLVRELVWPCLFTATTTAAGFVSLYWAGSRPIIDFGFLMAAGVGLAFALSFVVIPAAVCVLPDERRGKREASARVLEGLGRLALRGRFVVFLAALALVGAGVEGVRRLEVEARFVDYFHPESDLHQGLTFIDRHLGGTSGLEVFLQAPNQGAFALTKPDNLERVAEVVRWLEDREEVGAVMSYVGLVDEAGKLLLGQEVDASNRPRLAQQLALWQARLPPLRETFEELSAPYVLVEERRAAGEVYPAYSGVLVASRVFETREGLERQKLRAELEAFLAERFPEDGEIQAGATGMFVLYENMLSSLARSQVTTSAIALGAIWLMLTLLYRSPLAGTLGVIPNLIPIVLAVGAMGWWGVPLDMATVMIASVSLGIGVDCAIHYLFRYREEVRRDGDVGASLVRAHGSIGISILFTSLTSVVGFSVLAASEFRPNAYFGVLTGVAMVAALFAMLTVLPVLVLWVRPFRRAMREGAAQPSPERPKEEPKDEPKDEPKEDDRAHGA